MRQLALVTVLFAGAGWAADVETAINTTFLQPWIGSIRANQPLNPQFLHPRVRACINERTREYFDSISSNSVGGTTAGYHITKLAAWQGPGPLWTLPPDGFSYPVEPTYELHLKFDKSNTELVRYLAPAGKAWYMVLPCPNEKGIAFVHENALKAKAQKEQAAKLVAELKEPLRGELLALLKQRRLLEAVKFYQKTTGQQDFTLAVMVINAIDPEHPLDNR
jgi:hypothetical protein